MIDTHTHILAALDDGPQTWNQAIEMCYMAYEDGIRTIVATPHILPGIFVYPPQVILEKLAYLQTLLQEERLDITLLPGAELHADPDLLTKIQKQQVLSLNHTSYILLEFSFSRFPPRVEEYVGTFIHQGITPIIAHAERIKEVQAHPQKLSPLVRRGALVQVTSMSLTGGFGPAAQRCAALLLQHNLCHIIASDAHSLQRRPPLLTPGVDVAAQLIGETRARAMVTTIPQAVVRGERVKNLLPLPSILRQISSER
ncbi:MAG: tyrosine protein phosphatase [Nitrospinota bacterium]|nr:MAG: tyrosine protein phosphatase [Nitrospinota bacterium]